MAKKIVVLAKGDEHVLEAGSEKITAKVVGTDKQGDQPREKVVEIEISTTL